ncbi:MAG: NAD-dependent epimerase/dehydratase family protein [Flavobacteriaceae bacterium]|nr:NAD-dependent epimerase/dehydratase family protein [Flavobacteriaceae bacterium]
MANKTLIIGACGQIGSELTEKLRALKGNSNVVASDIREGDAKLVESGPFQILNATDYDAIKACVLDNEVSEVYLMAAMLSATGEKHPAKAWDLNMNSLFHVLNLAKEKLISKVFWPSSIAVFGPTTPKVNTPQYTVMEPTTVYGITKQVGERWCAYYHENYDVDVRSIRYPGIISWKTLPGGGTTDYAIEIFHKALEERRYESFIDENTALPMMYMDDAIKATLDIMSADASQIKIRSSYNVAGISFKPKDIASLIKRRISEFEISYKPDYRQQIADTWPSSIDDTCARKDWNWSHQYDLEALTDEMITNLESTLQH